MAKKDGGPAFPLVSGDRTEEEPGMSKRDWFAGQALPVIMRASDIQDVHAWDVWAQRVATAAYEVADAMLAERERK